MKKITKEKRPNGRVFKKEGDYYASHWPGGELDLFHSPAGWTNRVLAVGIGEIVLAIVAQPLGATKMLKPEFFFAEPGIFLGATINNSPVIGFYAHESSFPDPPGSLE